MMEMVMGRMPERFAREGAASKAEYFKDGARLDWPKPKATKQSRKDVKACLPLHVSVRPFVFDVDNWADDCLILANNTTLRSA